MNRVIRQVAAKNDFLSLRVSVACLLFGYITVFLFSPAILRHDEHDHVDHRRDTCEKDPCHISIYHAGKEGGCNHKFHFTTTPEKCEWCDVILAYQLSTSNIILGQYKIDFPNQAVLTNNGESIRISV